MSEQPGQTSGGPKMTPDYPYADGDFVVIGPECFALPDGSVLSWRGENYTRQRPTLRVRLHNVIVRWRNGRA